MACGATAQGTRGRNGACSQSGSELAVLLNGDADTESPRAAGCWHPGQAMSRREGLGVCGSSEPWAGLQLGRDQPILEGLLTNPHTGLGAWKLVIYSVLVGGYFRSSPGNSDTQHGVEATAKKIQEIQMPA